MGKNSNKLGAVVLEHQGYKVRQIMSSKTDPKTKRTVYNHTGKYGVYSGKTLHKDGISDPLDSMAFINSKVDTAILERVKETKVIEERLRRSMEAEKIANRRTWK